MVKAAHAYNQEQREITYAWMIRWTGGDSKDFWEENANIEKDEDLWATKMGSVYNEPGSREPQEWVIDYLLEHQFEPKIIKSQKTLRKHKTGMVKLIEHVLNTDFDHIAVDGDLEVSRSEDDITIQPFVLKPETGIVLPGIILESTESNPNQDVILYISHNGKSDILKDMDMVGEMLKEGYRVCAVDLRGIGETSPDMKNRLWDFLAGKPIFGQRVRDILATVKWLKESEIGAQNIKFWGTGTAALYGAFAGVLSNDLSAFVFEEPLLSFESVVQVKIPEYRNEVMLPGILEEFDMPQVYQALSPRPVTILNPHLGDKTFADKSDIEKTEKLVSATYNGIKKLKNWHIAKVNEQERKRIVMNILINK